MHTMAKRHRVVVIAVVTTLLLLGALYYFVDPGSSLIAPKCVVKALTGYDCPSCGGQRALHALLHGRVGEAFLFNPFLVVAVPYLLLLVYAQFAKTPLSERVRRVTHHPVTIWSYVVLFFVWWVVRNTHWWLALSGTL